MGDPNNKFVKNVSCAVEMGMTTVFTVWIILTVSLSIGMLTLETDP